MQDKQKDCILSRLIFDGKRIKHIYYYEYELYKWVILEIRLGNYAEMPDSVYSIIDTFTIILE